MSVLLPNADSDYYWRLFLRDGRKIDVPPKFVPLVKRKMDNKETVHTSSGSIPYAQIESFDKTSRRFTDVALLEDTARAFNEPLISEEGDVKARWAKKAVSRSEWDKKLSKYPHYTKLREEGDMIIVAFIVPVHKFDATYMEYLTDEEEKKMTY